MNVGVKDRTGQTTRMTPVNTTVRSACHMLLLRDQSEPQADYRQTESLTNLYDYDEKCKDNKQSET